MRYPQRSLSCPPPRRKKMISGTQICFGLQDMGQISMRKEYLFFSRIRNYARKRKKQ